MQLSKADIKHNNAKAEIGDRIAVEQKFNGDIIIDNDLYFKKALCKHKFEFKQSYLFIHLPKQVFIFKKS